MTLLKAKITQFKRSSHFYKAIPYYNMSGKVALTLCYCGSEKSHPCCGGVRLIPRKIFEKETLNIYCADFKCIICWVLLIRNTCTLLESSVWRWKLHKSLYSWNMRYKCRQYRKRTYRLSGVGNLRHACQACHAERFSMACLVNWNTVITIP
jgi:hypothetical protein